MDLNLLHFAQPIWFWSLLCMPLVWTFFFLYQKQEPVHQLEKFIDKHLLPHLLVKQTVQKKKFWSYILLWSSAWILLTVALAGPHWSFREGTTFTRDQSLVILLDLSESMNTTDVSPSRLGRAKQKIEDLIHMSEGVKIGLIAFAADPHMITPMTEDKKTIQHLLPSLDTDLVYIQGSKLTPALEMAGSMLEKQPGNNKAIAIISDGGFTDASAIYTAKNLAQQGICLYTIGVGSLEGAPLKDPQGSLIKQKGSVIFSRLEKEKFSEISKVGRGRYFDADHSQKISQLFEDLKKKSDLQEEVSKTQRFWEEHFYLFLLPILPLFLWWSQRGHLFALLFFTFFSLPSYGSLKEHFYNREQKAKAAYEQENFSLAEQSFQDPYRKGVTLYRMGDYSSAEEMFKLSTRPEVAAQAAYNLGNAQVQQNKLQEAITTYEDILERWPDHLLAKENLQLARQMLEQQETSNQNGSGDQSKKDSSSQDKSSEEKQESSESDDSEEKDSPSDEKRPEEERTSQENQNSETEPKEEKELPAEPEQEHSEKEEETPPMPQKQPRSQEDLDADLWLDQIKNEPKAFLKNKFYLESKKNGTKQESNPW